MTRFLWFASVLTALVICIGCDSRYSSSSEIAIEPKKQAASAEMGKQAVVESEALSGGNENGENNQPSSSMTEATWNQVNKLYQQAKRSGQTSANSAGQWMKDVWNSTTASSVEISQQSQNWLTSQYLKAKEKGSTTADSASEYFQSEFNKIGTWEYKVVTQPFVKSDEEASAAMNELGTERWECFATTSSDGNLRTFYRRKVKSDFDNIPTRDLMRIVMALAGGGWFSAGDAQ